MGSTLGEINDVGKCFRKDDGDDRPLHFTCTIARAVGREVTNSVVAENFDLAV